MFGWFPLLFINVLLFVIIGIVMWIGISFDHFSFFFVGSFFFGQHDGLVSNLLQATLMKQFNKDPSSSFSGIKNNKNK